MKVFYWVYKGNSGGQTWESHEKFKTYEEALEFLTQSKNTVSHQYWKISKVWEWPF